MATQQKKRKLFNVIRYVFLPSTLRSMWMTMRFFVVVVKTKTIFKIEEIVNASFLNCTMLTQSVVYIMLQWMTHFSWWKSSEILLPLSVAKTINHWRNFLFHPLFLSLSLPRLFFDEWISRINEQAVECTHKKKHLIRNDES